ncbi:MAG: hypothetical protein R3293_06055 [Candidatus Promineifilaceae bacterium]|nr:hypothetical protein [Candidatus Promineifilaceae bacterium]
MLILTYFVTIAYAWYESFTIFIYQTDVIFYAQFHLIVDGFAFLIEHLRLSPTFIASVILTIAVSIALLVIVIKAVLRDEVACSLSLWSKVSLMTLLILSLYAVLFHGRIMDSPKSAISSQIAKLQKNIGESRRLVQEVKAMEDLDYPHLYNYDGYSLLARPNIYLVFIESYGSILYKREAFRDSYFSKLEEKQRILQSNGWFTSSALSESTSWGGGSWMAYTSLLFGMRVDNHPQYLSLLDRFQEEAYPDFGFTLRSLGYRYIRATSLAVELDDEEWQRYVNFFGVDDWIRYRDFDYHGMHYGWGPSPPDQYILSAAHERISKQSEDPFFLFLITQNSHYPWRRVPELADDWNTLNDGHAVVALFDEQSTPLSVKQDNYIEAISYQLDFLVDFISNQAADDDIFILVGDHQPGYVSRRSDGFDTPLHIISRDRNFVEAFSAYGFEPELKLNNTRPAIKHEGFYSLFMNVFLRYYGQGKTPPPYLPDGIDLSGLSSTITVTD